MGRSAGAGEHERKASRAREAVGGLRLYADPPA
jgi:hypothetical protein